MHARVLDEADRSWVTDLLGRDPVVNCFVASRVDAGVLGAGPGELWGYPAHAPRSLLHVGANVVAVNPDDEALDAFTEDLGRRRGFVAIVGPAPVAVGLWQRLARRYGRPYAEPRLVRERQYLMTRATTSPVPADPRVRHAGSSDFDSYLAGAVAMYREELDEDPLQTNYAGYRRYVRSLIDSRRAYTITLGGEVVFKADLGAVSDTVAQVQGVWVTPRLRGQGMSVPAMAAVTNAIVADGLIASLYVNDFNAAAVASYRSCGYTIVDEMASILY